MAAPGPWGKGGFRSHRHAGLGQQLQGAGQADVRGHGQQPARIVPVMGPLQEQHGFFISPKRGVVSSHHLPHSHLLAPLRLCSASFPAPLLRKRSRKSAPRERTWRSSCLLHPRRCSQSGRAATARAGVVDQDCGLCATKPKRIVHRPHQEFVLKAFIKSDLIKEEEKIHFAVICFFFFLAKFFMCEC